MEREIVVTVPGCTGENVAIAFRMAGAAAESLASGGHGVWLPRVERACLNVAAIIVLEFPGKTPEDLALLDARLDAALAAFATAADREACLRAITYRLGEATHEIKVVR